jgi:N-acetyl-anhydromuramyl-L-alanine amidase AmpD
VAFIEIHKPYVVVRAPEGEFGHGPMTPVRVILHDTESHGVPHSTADIEGVIRVWLRTPKTARLGAHFIVDRDGNVGQTAGVRELLFHTGGLNDGSIGIEQIGFAAFTRAEWLARPAQLEKVARLLAWMHKRHAIRLTVPSHRGHGLPMHGVLTHAMVSRFEPGSEGHSDPGRHYPLKHVLARAHQIRRDGGWERQRP